MKNEKERKLAEQYRQAKQDRAREQFELKIRISLRTKPTPDV